ncbi:MAG TPA: CBS domain-containing protein [Usitatibacter sp.]|nr:CBS domain-containing protein [Usitatibacter sp.]
MKVERVYTARIMATTRHAPIIEAAAAMRRYGVGSLLVLEGSAPSSKAVGIVTDRDLALEGFASESSEVGQAMTPVVATVRASADVHEALALMRGHGARRPVVTDDAGEIGGIVSIDDIVDGLAVELAAAAAVLKGGS